MVIKRLDLSQYPQCGADAWIAPGRTQSEGVRWTRRLVDGVAPGGRPAIQIDHIGVADPAIEYYHGCYAWNVPPAPPDAVRYARVLMRLLHPIRWAGEGGGRFGFKFIMIGQDGANDTNRAIINLRSSITATGGDSANVLLRGERNIGIGPSRVDVSRLPIGEWFTIQVRVRGGANGGLDVYINNDEEARPTASSPGTQEWETTGWDVVRFGYYGQSLGRQGHASYQIAAFEYADTFDAAWHSGVIEPPPPPPPPVDPPPPPPPPPPPVTTNYRVTVDTRATVDFVDGQPQNVTSTTLARTVTPL